MSSRFCPDLHSQTSVYCLVLPTDFPERASPVTPKTCGNSINTDSSSWFRSLVECPKEGLPLDRHIQDGAEIINAAKKPVDGQSELPIWRRVIGLLPLALPPHGPGRRNAKSAGGQLSGGTRDGAPGAPACGSRVGDRRPTMIGWKAHFGGPTPRAAGAGRRSFPRDRKPPAFPARSARTGAVAGLRASSAGDTSNATTSGPRAGR